jgi:hypothetical protein
MLDFYKRKERFLDLMQVDRVEMVKLLTDTYGREYTNALLKGDNFEQVIDHAHRVVLANLEKLKGEL